MEAMKKKTGAVDEKRETNFLETTTRSPEKSYYEFLLRKEKLAKIKAKGIEEQWLTQDEADALETVSDKEKLELKIRVLRGATLVKRWPLSSPISTTRSTSWTISSLALLLPTT